MIRREYPDIEFVETDTETIENSMIALFELMYKKMTGKTKKVYPASPERLFIAWAASIVIQQRIIINETAKKNVPRYANGKYLASLGELFKDTFRLPEARATALFRFYISEPQEQSVIVPQGTRINFDREIVFSTTEELEIRAGDAYGDILGECLTPGIVGNNIAAGQIKEIMDTYDFFWKVENITRTAGGADKESDQSYYERLRESMEGFSTAGPVGGYIYHVKSVSTAITDVTATSPEPGLVDIRVLLNGGEMPTEATMQEIQDALNASTVRPLTDRVIVSKPEEVPFSVDVTIYLPRYSQTSSTIIERDARSAVAAYPGCPVPLWF